MEEAQTTPDIRIYDHVLEHALAQARVELSTINWQPGIFGDMVIALRKQYPLELKEAAEVVADFCHREAPDVFVPDFTHHDPFEKLVSYDDFLRTHLDKIRSELSVQTTKEQYMRLLHLLAEEVNVRQQGSIFHIIVLDYFCNRFEPELFAVSITEENCEHARKRRRKGWWQVWPFHRTRPIS